MVQIRNSLLHDVLQIIDANLNNRAKVFKVGNTPAVASEGTVSVKGWHRSLSIS